MGSAYTHLQQWLLAPAYAAENLEEHRRIRMVMLLTLFHLVLITLALLQFLAAGELPLPAVVQFSLNALVLALVIARQFKLAVNFLISTFVFSHFFALLFSDLTNLLYIITSFVAVSVLINRRLRLAYAVVTLMLVGLVGLSTAANPVYAAGVTHANVVLFTMVGIVSITISTSIVEGDLRQIRAQLQATRQSEMRYRLLAENINDMVTLYTPELKLLYASPSYVRATGYTEAELLAMPLQQFWELIHFEDETVEAATAYHHVEGKTVATFKYRHRRKDGSYFWAETFSVPISADNGEITQIVSSTRDITERIRTENALRESQHRARVLLDAIPDQVYRLRRDGTILDVGGNITQAYADPRTLGNIRAIFENSPLPPTLLQYWLHTINTTLDEQTPQLIEYQMDYRGGIKQAFEARLFPINTNELMCIIRNVTESKQIEQALAIRNEYLTTLHQISLDILQRRDRDDLLQALVDKAAAILDAPYVKMMLFEDDALVVRAYTQNQPFVKGSVTPRADNIFAVHTWRAYDTQQPVLLDNYVAYAKAHQLDVDIPLGAIANFPVIIGKDCIGILGLARAPKTMPFTPEQIEIGQMLSRLTALVVDNINQYNAALQEIKERQNAENALRRSEQRAQSLLNAIPDQVYRVSADGVVLDMGGNLADALFKPHQIISQPLRMLLNGPSFAPNLVEQAQAAFQMVLAQQQPQTVETQVHYPAIGMLEFEARLFPISADEITVIIRNITERKRIERELQDKHAQLLEAQQLTHLGSWRWDVATNTITWSEELQRIFGIDAEDFQVSYEEYLRLLHPDDRDKVSDAISHAYQRQQPYEVYHRIIHPEKGERIIHGRGQTVTDDDGKVQSMLGTAQDVTELKHAEQALAVRNQYLTALYQISLDMLNRRDLDDLLQVVVDNAAIILDAPFAEMMLKAEDTLVVRAFTQNQAFLKGDKVKRHEARLSWQAHDTRQPAIVEDYSTWENRREIYREIQLRAVADFPVMIGAECIGVLCLSRTKKNYPFTPEQIEIGVMFSQLAALVVDNINQYHAALQEIQERQQVAAALRQSEARAQAILNAIPDQVYRVSAEGTILEVHGNMATAYLPPEQMIGRNIDDFIRMGLVSSELADIGIRLIQKAIQDQQMQIIEYQMISPQQEAYDFEARLVTSGTDEVTMMVRNITERKAAENRQHLLTSELRAVNSELKDFAYIISHDLKAPLRGISALADWLLADYGAHLDTGGQDMLHLMTQRVRRMEAMINGVLEYSRLGQHTPSVRVDLNHLVAHIIEDIAPNTPHQITIHHPLPIVLADPMRLRQVFQNLLDNAIKYMDKPIGEIHITCQAQAEAWLFSISDNGPGIEAQYFDKIFHIFQTLQPRDEIESTGIGLTIVKRIIEAYGGKIWVQSTVGTGSIFNFTLQVETIS